ncbi:YbaY family lipoprotein [Pseudomonas japonica]|uniref:YbaY family lipoprotein n=1 Tax=Pseudomonas japonica TaxID=256466 RepID=UPI0038002E87
MNSKAESLYGEVFYESRVPVPATATFTVRLYDVSIEDISYPIIAEQEEPVGDRGVPLPFHLTYDCKQLKPGHRYAVRGQITDETRYLFLNIAMEPVELDGSDPQPLRIKLDTALG